MHISQVKARVFIVELIDFIIKLMDFIVQLMDFILKMIDSVLKTIVFTVGIWGGMRGFAWVCGGMPCATVHLHGHCGGRDSLPRLRTGLHRCAGESTSTPFWNWIGWSFVRDWL